MKKVFYDAPRKNRCPKCGNSDIQGDVQKKGRGQNNYEILARCPVCGERWILVPIKASVKIPLTKSGRDAMANDLLIKCNVCATMVSKATSLSDFFRYWEELMFELERLSAFEGHVKFTKETPSACKKRLTSEFQEKLRAAIDRNKEKVIYAVKNDSTNLAEEVNKFLSAIRCNMKSFSKETVSFARAANNEIQSALKKQQGIISKNVDCARIIDDEMRWRRQQMGKSPIEVELDRIDSMDGHTFERWCANLLEASGLIDVEVTRGSGDQGVDVLATLDGVRYAVQCKCYSSDLGNKPIQEVFAGAVIYKCQVGAVMTNRHFTAGAKELAAATGVSLWDRDWIISLLEKIDPELFPL